MIFCMFFFHIFQLFFIGTRDGFGLGADPRLEGFPTYSMMHNDATGKFSLNSLI